MDGVIMPNKWEASLNIFDRDSASCCQMSKGRSDLWVTISLSRVGFRVYLGHKNKPTASPLSVYGEGLGNRVLTGGVNALFPDLLCLSIYRPLKALSPGPSIPSP